MAESPLIDLKSIEAFLKENFTDDVSDIKIINGGERSKAFSFLSQKIKYILRINSHDDGFKKDMFAFEHLSNLVPIPKILKIGNYKNKFYCISEFCSGMPLTDSDSELPFELVKNIFSVADKIHSVPVSHQTKNGVADVNGIARFDSWKDWVLKDNTVVTKSDGSYYSWNEVKEIPFVDEKVINDLRMRIKELVHFVPKEKYLIHGDYGTGNIMVDNNLVTGVIDWNEFGYGDFLFDIAWLDFWIQNTDFKEAYKTHNQKNHKVVPCYEERMLCHQLFIGLNTLGIYAAIGWEGGYKSTLERIKKVKF